MIPARHMSALIFSASQALTECLEMVQKLHIRACPTTGAFCSTSVLGRMLFLFPNLGWESSAGWSGNRCLPVPAWLLWGLRLFQVEPVRVVVKGKCFFRRAWLWSNQLCSFWVCSVWCYLNELGGKKHSWCVHVSFSCSKTSINELKIWVEFSNFRYFAAFSLKAFFTSEIYVS